MSEKLHHQAAPEALSPDRADILEVLENPSCRKVLTTLNGRSLTAKEISEASNIPLSTVYRVVSDLGVAGFVAESIRFNDDGRHVTEFSRTISSVTVNFEDEIIIEVEPRGDP